MAISSGLGGAVGAVPIGSVTAFAGATAPSGWLLCAGQTVSRTQYSGLFLTIGTTYGAGDGSTTFALPDLRGRVIAGEDDMGGTAANRLTSAGSGITGTSLGAVGGVETVTLTAAQSGIPAHSHTASTDTAGAHTHTEEGVYRYTGNVGYASPGYYDGYYPTTRNTGSAGSHSHTVTVSNNTAANASQAHSNTQPTIVLNYIIKAQ